MQQHEWMKVHLICGVRTNVVTAVVASDKDANDSPFLPQLVSETRRRCTMNEVSADKQYSSKNNLHQITAAGAMPFVPFKEGTTGGQGGMTLWKKLFHYYSFQRDEFLRRYHLRSNVESTMWMIKSKFGEALRSKGQVAQFNEALCRVLCHNLCCLIQSMHEFGIDPAFWTQLQAA